MKFKINPLSLSIMILLWYLCSFIVFPVILTIYRTITLGGSFDISNYIILLTQANYRQIFTNTLMMALGSIPLCALVGISSALCIHGVKVPMKNFWHTIMLLPMVIPGTVVVIAYITLYGNRGLLGWPIREMLGLDFSAYPFSGLGAILITHMFTQYIYFYLLTSEAVNKIDSSQIEAARSLGAKPWKIFGEIVFPSFAPALSSATVLTLLSSSGSFSAPFLLGGNFRVLSTSIYRSTSQGQTDLGLTQAILFSVIIITLIAILRIVESKLFKGVNSKGNVQSFQPLDDPFVIKICTGYLGFLAVIILLPIFAMLIVSFGKIGTWEKAFHSAYTFDNYLMVLTNKRNIQPFINTFMIGIIGTIGALIIGVWVAFIVTRTKMKMKNVLESVGLLPALLPSSALLAVLISVYSVPTIFMFGITLTGTWWLLPLSLIVLRLPVMIRSASASLITMPSSLEEASLSLGANTLQTFFYVVVPYIMQGLKFSAIITFIFIIGDFSAPAFTAIPANKTVVMSMIGNVDAQRLEVAMAYGVLLLIFISSLIYIFDPLEMKKEK